MATIDTATHTEFWGTYRDILPGDQVQRQVPPAGRPFYPGFVQAVQFWGAAGPVNLTEPFVASGFTEYESLHPAIWHVGGEWGTVVNPDVELWITRNNNN